MREKTRTHRGHAAKVVELHVPGKSREQSRFHLVKRRAQNAPWWMWAATALILIVAAFMAGSARSDGRSSVLAEQLGLAQTEANELRADNAELLAEQTGLLELRDELTAERNRLSSELAASVPESEFAALKDQYDYVDGQLVLVTERLEAVEADLAELQPLLQRAEARAEQLEEVVVPTLQRQLEFQSNRANRLQATLTTQERALPGQIAAGLNASPATEPAEYRIAVSQTILRESFGIRFGSINDETLAVTAIGAATFSLAERPITASPSGVIRVGLPRLVSSGLSDLSFNYDMGFLARIGDQDVTDLMAWVEQNQLQPKACGDTASLRGLVAQVEQRVRAEAGGQDIEVVWVDSAGREFDNSQLTNATLLGEAC